MFNDEKVTKWFNQGYNPDDRYIPINEKNRNKILELLNVMGSGELSIDAHMVKS